MYNQYPWFPNFIPFCYTTSHFRDTCNFETSALNDPKMTLNTTRSKVPHICFTSVNESHISLGFALQPVVFWDTSHFETNALNDPKWTFNPARSNYPKDVEVVSLILNFTPFRSMTSRFRVTGAPNDPQIDFEHYRFICAPYVCY